MNSIVDNLVGKEVQVYFSNTNKILKYSDYDLEQNLYVEGTVKWASGPYFGISCEVSGPNNQKAVKEMVLNSWAVLGVMEIDGNVRFRHIMKSD
jgi:hypothetical protein